MATERELSTIEEIAVLIASLDEKVAASILQQLEPHTMSRVADAIRNLGIISGEEREKAIRDCVQGIVQMGRAVQGDEKTVGSLLKQAIGEKRAAAMLEDRTTNTATAFNDLRDVSSEEIASVLESEQPSVAAIVLKHLPAQKAGEILGMLPDEMKRQCVVQMCTGKQPSAEAINCIQKYIEEKTGHEENSSAVPEQDDKVGVVSNILQNVDKSTEESLLAAIDEASESLGGEIRDRLFTFEDIVRMDDVAMRRILQEIDMTLLSQALRNASMDVQGKFFNNMSKRAREGLKQEMEFSQKMKRSEVEAKQKEIVNIIRSLEADGQINIGEEGGDEYV